jgi:predicted ATP-grasp superfamily ATP-dependent carboligase
VSRWTTAALVVDAGALATAAGYRAAVATVVRAQEADVVIPVTDTASRALLGHDAQLGARVAGPAPDAYERASDKAGLLAVAAASGVRVPRQLLLASPTDASQLASWAAAAAVVKPSRSVVEINGKSHSTGVRFVDDRAQLAATVAAYPAEAYPLMIQERTFGMGVGVFLLRAAGETRLRFGHRRLREKPPAGGVSTYREAIEPPPVLQAQCERLLDALGYEGAAMIEFKQDRATGEFVLMEINARLWGSVQLAVDAGVDFPAALVDLTLGHPIPRASAVRQGVRTWWELGELDHALAIWRRTREQLHAPPELRVGAGAALRALADRRWADHPEVFRWSDPMPFAAELARWLRRA